MENNSFDHLKIHKKSELSFAFLLHSLGNVLTALVDPPTVQVI